MKSVRKLRVFSVQHANEECQEAESVQCTACTFRMCFLDWLCEQTRLLVENQGAVMYNRVANDTAIGKEVLFRPNAALAESRECLQDGYMRTEEWMNNS
ncbi:hypothetical protein MAR_005792 [Mya arenaria]|uniref:Uncharacterized protein n=1 Tax=Mya arenaria TaxID=6604 RepID=A0ABY7F3P5_MYAAR|nr:hypothetical protein MAR_005792 [Mya arenaria]